jgi:hypothetical protein
MREAVDWTCCIDAHISVTSCKDCDGLETGSLTEYGGGELKDTLFDILTVLERGDEQAYKPFPYLGLGEDRGDVKTESSSSSMLISAACQLHIELGSDAKEENDTVKQVLLAEIFIPDAYILPLGSNCRLVR